VDDIFLFLTIVMAGVSGLLIFVSSVSWHRLRSFKLALVSCAFVIFFIKALLLISEIVHQDEKGVIIDCIILVFLYFAVIKK